jgi:hypothetical protein
MITRSKANELLEELYTKETKQTIASLKQQIEDIQNAFKSYKLTYVSNVVASGSIKGSVTLRDPSGMTYTFSYDSFSSEASQDISDNINKKITAAIKNNSENADEENYYYLGLGTVPTEEKKENEKTITTPIEVCYNGNNFVEPKAPDNKMTFYDGDGNKLTPANKDNPDKEPNDQAKIDAIIAKGNQYERILIGSYNYTSRQYDNAIEIKNGILKNIAPLQFPEAENYDWGRIAYFGIFESKDAEKPIFVGRLPIDAKTEEDNDIACADGKCYGVYVKHGQIPIFRAEKLKIGLDSDPDASKESEENGWINWDEMGVINPYEPKPETTTNSAEVTEEQQNG